MDEALVEDPQHEVDHEDRDDEEEPLALERGLERLRRALEAPDDRRREPELPLGLLHFRHRLAERHAGLEVERDRHRRELAQMRDRQGPDGRSEEHTSELQSQLTISY